MSSAEVEIKIEISGVGTIYGKFIRHICPISADAVIEKLPINLRGRFSFGSKKYWTLPGLNLYKGVNQAKATKDVKKGDIVYSPKTDELYFILEDLGLQNRVNKIGLIESGFETFLKARNGLNTKISK